MILILSLVSLLLVDHADLGDGWKQLVRSAIPAAAILVPAAFFLSVVRPRAERPGRIILLAPLGAVSLSVGLLTLGVSPGWPEGAMRRRPDASHPSGDGRGGR